MRFEPVKLESLFQVLDAVAWLDEPTVASIAQFAGVDPRTAGKLLKNAEAIGLVAVPGGRRYTLEQPYPAKGNTVNKEAVVREALVRMPLLVSFRQFRQLGESTDNALRKAATVHGSKSFDPKALSPLVAWAERIGALKTDMEELLEVASADKRRRHRDRASERIVFLSHSSKDKAFVRQLATDLMREGVGVWLDELRIGVGESIPEKVAQGLASSDFFVIAISRHSVASEWVRKELNSALVREIERRSVMVLPAKLDESAVPEAIKDKKYADFTVSYKAGLNELLAAIRGRTSD